MRLNRRNTLIGLGALAVGSGALASTGAFTTVEAQRDVNVAVAGDADAFLQLDPAAETEAAELVDGLLVLTFDENLSTDGAGLNMRAITTFAPLFNIGNNGNEEVAVYLEGVDVDDNDADTITNTIDDGGGNELVIEYTFEITGGSDTFADDHGSIVGDGNALAIPVGEFGTVDLHIDVGAPDAGFAIGSAQGFMETITITAERTST